MNICCVKCRRPDYNGNFALPMCEDMLCECHCPINKEKPKGWPDETWETEMGEKPKATMKDVILARTEDQSDWEKEGQRADWYSPDAIVFTIPQLKFLLSSATQQVREEEHQFFLNILDGIDQADKDMGNEGGGTEAIRLALKSRSIK